MTHVTVHIETLVLHGFLTQERQHISRALEVGLERLIAEHGFPASLGTGASVEVVDGGQFVVSPGMSASGVGKHLAQSVFGGIERVSSQRWTVR